MDMLSSSMVESWIKILKLIWYLGAAACIGFLILWLGKFSGSKIIKYIGIAILTLMTVGFIGMGMWR